ncbi:double zinc ribbon domain-containing protein [Phaeovulum sp.]|uniref:double zinc ribbon domain-containing protein n=1 Tax=Phaeovulum sp. TaxID=2934796 RepID=UPI0039E5C000
MFNGLRRGMLGALHLVFPPRCIGCGGAVASDFGLCGACWCDTPFVTGLACDKCGAPLPGDDEGTPVLCDECMRIDRPWNRGRAALTYQGTGRRLILALKHGDRLDLVPPLAGWLHRAALPLLSPDMLVAPIPLHRLRLLKRRYNQSALLSREMARIARLDHCPDLLLRSRITPSQEGLGRDARFANVNGALAVTPKRKDLLAGRKVLLVDDVMTSGATLAVAAEACMRAGAALVCVVTLARVAKDA